jgi:hypothetical protein
MNNQQIERVKLELLKGKTWRYLRYLHASQALAVVTDWHDVLVIGAGNGLAELVLAMEYPDKHFHLTDHEAATHSFRHAKNFQQKYDIKNISFGSLNILEPESKGFDIVYSVEVLEHIKEDKKAALNMNNLAKKYVFCLVPFAEKSLNDNKVKREDVLKRFEHFVVGYDENTLTNFFPNPIAVRGCYWADEGLAFRLKLSNMDIPSIEESYNDLVCLAKNDIKKQVQLTQKQALGIWIISAVQ